MNWPKYLAAILIVVLDFAIIVSLGLWLKNAGLPTWAIVLLLGK